MTMKIYHFKGCDFLKKDDVNEFVAEVNGLNAELQREMAIVKDIKETAEQELSDFLVWFANTDKVKNAGILVFNPDLVIKRFRQTQQEIESNKTGGVH